MKRHPVAALWALTFLASAGTLLSQATPADSGWPRVYANGSASLVVHQPQVDRWSDFRKISGRCAVAISPARGREPVYGTFRFEADTLVDPDLKLVLLRNINAFDMRFPPSTASVPLADLTRQLLPSEALVVALDRLLAFVQAKEVPRKEARVLTGPPPIFVSTHPAVLVIIDGEPVLLPVEKTSLERVLNTNWELYRDTRTGMVYLRTERAWLGAASFTSSFAPVPELPPGLASLPAPGQKPVVAGPAPRVFLVTRPAELIVLQGQPALSPIAGTALSSVNNTDSDLFFHSPTRAYYFLTSGRWFQSATLEGPWQYASQTLPDDFRKIPADHARARVLAAVPGTREAEDAILLASIPRTAQVNRREAKAEAHYVGTPQFVPIPGTPVSYAKNSPNDVLRMGDLYYFCLQGVWFVSTTPAGPWEAAARVAPEIYEIPESSPKYHVTYVRVYDATPSAIVVGYTPGYSGAYISGGAVVWGTGYYYPPYVAVGVAAVPVYWSAPYYTYGASVWYNPSAGVYTRGGAVYGPYGGYGAATAYNPRTGTYAQGASIWGSSGGAAAGRTYNPISGTYSAGYAASNPYGSWGEGVVGNGSNWARGGYQTTSRGTVAAGETSKGGRGVAVEGANGRDAYLAKSGSGDVYAGANGNVYKRDGGQWYQRQDGSWNAVNQGDLNTQRQQAAARDSGNRNTQMSDRWRSGSAGRAQGLEQRPHLQGGGGRRRR